MEKQQEKNDGLVIQLNDSVSVRQELEQEVVRLRVKEGELVRFRQEVEPQYKKQLQQMQSVVKQKEEQLGVLEKKMDMLRKSQVDSLEGYRE